MEVPPPPAERSSEEEFRSSFGYSVGVDYRPKVPRAARLFAPEGSQRSQREAGMTVLTPFRSHGGAGRTAMAPTGTAWGDAFPH
jgi:hypothetical protein